jgi:hypothetical protein
VRETLKEKIDEYKCSIWPRKNFLKSRNHAPIDSFSTLGFSLFSMEQKENKKSQHKFLSMLSRDASATNNKEDVVSMPRLSFLANTSRYNEDTSSL